MQSEQIDEISKALSKAQSELQSANKDSNNPFFKSKYADLAEVWNVSREPLANNGLAVVQINEISEGKTCLSTILTHSSGQWIKGTLPLILTKNDMQGLGSAITYARRYGLSAILGVIQEDDDGNKTTRQSYKEEKIPVDMNKVPTISKTEATELKTIIDGFGMAMTDAYEIAGQALGTDLQRFSHVYAAQFDLVKQALIKEGQEREMAMGEAK